MGLQARMSWPRRPSRPARNVCLLQFRDGLESELELRHAAAALARCQRDGNAVVLEHGDEVIDDLRLVAIAVAGGEDDNASRRASRRFGLERGLRPAGLAPRNGAWNSAAAPRDALRACSRAGAFRSCSVRGIHDVAHDRDAGDAADDVGRDNRRSRKGTPPSVRTAFARSINCGKSTFQGCGGT